jgi:hypothetical protein
MKWNLLCIKNQTLYRKKFFMIKIIISLLKITLLRLVLTMILISLSIIGLTSCNDSHTHNTKKYPIVPVSPIPNNPANPNGLGPAPVNLSSNGGVLQAGDLGSAGNYVILAETGISNVTGSSITGNMGVSPAAASYITGFSLVADSSNVFSTSSVVIGKIYAADYAPPTPASLTSAISNMQTAYTDAAGRTNPDYTELAAGDIGGLTLSAGLYKWSSSITIPVDVTLSGGPNDVFILQIAGDLTMAAAKNIILSGGVQAKNVFFQVAGQVTIGTNSHFEGIILCKTAVVIQTNVVFNGRIYAQSAVTLDDNTITEQ